MNLIVFATFKLEQVMTMMKCCIYEIRLDARPTRFCWRRLFG